MRQYERALKDLRAKAERQKAALDATLEMITAVEAINNKEAPNAAKGSK